MRPGLPAVLLCVVLAAQALASGYSTFSAGIAAANRGDADESIRLLTQAIAAPDLSPQFLPAAHFIRGEAYFDKQQCDPVIADMSASLALNPAHFEAHLLRGFCYAIEKKQNDLVESDFTAAIGVRPDLVKGYLVRGVFYVETEQKYDSAIADFTVAAAIEPDNAEIYELRGNTYRLEGKYDEALTDEDKAIDTRPKFAAAYYVRGQIHEDQGKFEDAIDEFKTVVEISPNNTEASLNIGLTQWEAGRFGDAVQTFESTSKARPDNAYWALWLSLARAKAGKTDDDLALRAAKLDLAKWPGPVVNVFLGKITADQAVQAASIGSADVLLGQRCEANFYLGEWQSMHRNPSATKTMLTDAANACPHEFVEWPAANAELKRLP